MGTLVTLDKLLESLCLIRPFRWLLVGLIVALVAAAGWYGVKSYMLTLQVKGLKADNANLTAAVDVQNAAIEKQGKDMAELQKRLQAANGKAQALGRELQQRQADILALELTGDCPDMVQQVINEVIK